MGKHQIFISPKYAKDNKQNKLTAKQFKAKRMEEQAKANEELIANLIEALTKQMEILIKSPTESMKEMVNLMTLMVKGPANTNHNEEKTNWQERQKKYRDVPVYNYCNRKHLHKSESECWVLESNTSSRPTNWKAPKCTQRCVGSLIDNENWQPGKILEKIKISDTYSEDNNYWTSLQQEENEDE